MYPGGYVILPEELSLFRAEKFTVPGIYSKMSNIAASGKMLFGIFDLDFDKRPTVFQYVQYVSKISILASVGIDLLTIIVNDDDTVEMYV